MQFVIVSFAKITLLYILYKDFDRNRIFSHLIILNQHWENMSLPQRFTKCHVFFIPNERRAK